MRAHTSQAFVVLLTLIATPVYACKQLVKYPDHLTDTSSNWLDAYHVVEIVDAREDRIAGRIVKSFGGEVEKGQMTTFYFLPDEEAHAICQTPFEVGETYLVFSTTNSHRREISRFNWMNVPRSHKKFGTYIADLQRASAANKSLKRMRGR